MTYHELCQEYTDGYFHDYAWLTYLRHYHEYHKCLRWIALYQGGPR